MAQKKASPPAKKRGRPTKDSRETVSQGIRKLTPAKDGTERFEVRVFVGRDPVSGHPRQASRVVRGGIREARREHARMVTEADKKKLSTRSDTTVGQLVDAHLDQLERKGRSPKYLYEVRGYVKRVIRPELGEVSVRRLSAHDLDQLYNRLEDRGMKPSSRRQIHAILSGALEQGVRWTMCATNPAKMATAPTVRSPRIVPPTAAEVQAIVRAAEERDPILAALIGLAAITGARRGEMCGLQWSDVDLHAGTVHIARSILDIPDRLEPKPTKTHQTRLLALGDAGVALLDLHRRETLERARVGLAYVGPDAYVFSPRLDGAAPFRPDVVTKFFERVRNELGLRHVHLHSLRHFVATQLAARGDVSVRTIAGRLGHRNPLLTLSSYADFFPAADELAAEYLGRVLEPGDGSDTS